MHWNSRGMLVAGIVLLMPSLGLGSFVDTFESDPVGSFPANWTHFTPENSEVVVVDEVMDPGAVFDGDHSLRITFNGGYGSGVEANITPMNEGLMQFYARVDSFSDDTTLLGLIRYPHDTQPDEVIAAVRVLEGSPNYWYDDSVDTGVPIVVGQYVKFDLYFSTYTNTATLYINDTLTNVVDVPLQNPVGAEMYLLSAIESDPGGSARWYLDNVSVTPEPASLVLLSLGTVFLARRRRDRP